MASGYGFAQTAAKTPDHFFTGFPSYWNVVAFYLWALEWSPAANAVVLGLLAFLVFVPRRYAYPSRMPGLRAPTVSLGLVWGVVLLWALADPPRAKALATLSLAYPAYYAAVSVYLDRRRPVA